MARQTDNDGSDATRDPKPARSDRGSQVGDILRDAYADVLSEPIPDSFAELLRKLK